MQKEHDMAPGAQMRVITLQAPTKEAIDQCREIIQGMVQERIKTTNSTSTFGQVPVNPQDSKLQEALQAGHILVEIKVPDTDVGLIIGKSGVTIRGIQDRSGANIQIPQSGDLDNPAVRTVSITHAHAEGAALAKQLIDDLLSTKKEHVPFLTMQVEVSLMCTHLIRQHTCHLTKLQSSVFIRFPTRMLVCVLVAVVVLCGKCKISLGVKFKFLLNQHLAHFFGSPP